jgi:hypothetical protein
MSEQPDLIREALQVRINEGGEGIDNASYLVVHYVAIVGLYRANEDGTIDTSVIVATPHGQARYVTDGLLGHADEVLDEQAEFDEEPSTGDEAT